MELTLGGHAQESYGICLVRVSVCYHSSSNSVRFHAGNKVRMGLPKAFSIFEFIDFR